MARTVSGDDKRRGRTRLPAAFASLVSWLLPATLAVYGAGAQAAESAARPNIVLIMADDMGWSDAGCYGGEIRTPSIDTLAADGLRFSQFYNNAVCGPTRASLLTGLYPQQIGHAGHHWNMPKDFTKCVTVAEVLQEAGYHTMMVGKWQGRELAVERGFDRFFGPQCQGKISYYHEVQQNPFYLNGRRWQFPDDGFFMTDAFSDHAVQFLEEAAGLDEPFFLYAAYIAPHWPLHARESDIAAYRPLYLERGWEERRQERWERQHAAGIFSDAVRLSAMPAAIHDWSDDKYKGWQAERMAAYAAQISCMDRGIGRILEAIRASGEEDNTLVMFLSDNGAAPDGGLVPSRAGFGFSGDQPNRTWRIDGGPVRGGSGPEHMPGPPDTFAAYGLAWATVSNTPLRGTKLTAYEGGIRTPLIVRWPRVIREGGQWTDQAGHVMDLMATCLDAAGAQYPRQFGHRRPLPLEGKSLLPVFRGKQREPHRALYWDAPRNQAIRMGDWKLVSPKLNASWQLFNLAADPTETTDLAASQPQRVQQLREAFQQWRDRVGAR